MSSLIILSEAQEGLRYLEGVRQERELDDWELALKRVYQARVEHFTPKLKRQIHYQRISFDKLRRCSDYFVEERG